VGQGYEGYKWCGGWRASQVVRPWKSRRASTRAPSFSIGRALDLGGGGGVAEGAAAAVEQAGADRYPLSLATFWAPQPDKPERSSAPGRPSSTQHQPGMTRASHHSKITWAGIPSKTIMEPVFGQNKGARSKVAAGPRRSVRHAPSAIRKGFAGAPNPLQN